MSENKDNIIAGVPVGNIPECSFAQYIFPKLLALPKNKILQIDAETGAVQTADELLTSSIRFSRGIKKYGVNQNDVVGLLSRNSFEASIIVLGTWLAGSVIAPASGFMKSFELEHYLKTVNPKMVFCEGEMIESVEKVVKNLKLDLTVAATDVSKNFPSSHLTLKTILSSDNTGTYKPPGVECPTEDLLAIMPSSGTSGLPKGVGITHKNFIFEDIIMSYLSVYAEGGDCLQISHFFWVTGMFSFIRTLSIGMKRILLRETTVTNILKATQTYKPEWTFLAPLLLVKISESSEYNHYDLSSLKTILIGGSSFTSTMADRIKGKWNNTKIVQNYGTTEVGFATFGAPDGDLFSLGKTVPGVQLKVVDTLTQTALPAKKIGEIQIKSPGIMNGYVGNEEETKKATDEEGWFLTGDLGYYDESEQFYIVDRIKQMIKVMNMQVAPAEVENVILSIPGVKEVCVTGVTKDGNEFALVAVVVKKKNYLLTENDIKLQVENNLSDYKKLSGGVFFVDSLPKTASGKIQRFQVNKLALSLFQTS